MINCICRNTGQVLGLWLWFFSGMPMVYAQSTWNWPEDKKTAQGYYARYTDAFRSKDYKNAVEPLEWMLQHVPQLHKSLYQHGEIIYTKLAQATTASHEKEKYQARALEMLSLREQYYGEAKLVSNRSALLHYRFYKDKPEKLHILHETIQRAITLNQEHVRDVLLLAILDVLRRQKKAGTTITDEEFIETYSIISELFDKKRKIAAQDPDKTERLNTLSQKADKILTHSIQINCEFIDKVLGTRMLDTHQALAKAQKTHTDSPETAQPQISLRPVKVLLHLLKKYECENPDLYLKAVEMLYKTEPSSAMALLLARKFLKEKDQDKAFTYYEKALSLSQENKEKAEIYLDMARIYARNNKTTSRTYAQKAIEEDSTSEEAYNLIGSLYMSSYEECKLGISRVADRAIFIAAYRMFQKAKNIEKMAEAATQFPTAEQIFELGLSEGTKVQINCWVQEEVTLVKRKS